MLRMHTVSREILDKTSNIDKHNNAMSALRVSKSYKVNIIDKQFSLLYYTTRAVPNYNFGLLYFGIHH